MAEITVIVTTYNLESYIETCLQKLEEQTFRDFDVVVVDDCSTDGTFAVAQAYITKRGLPFHLLSTEKNHEMPAPTRNFALDSGLIFGKYLTFLDGDDAIEPDYLEKLYQTAQMHDADMVICSYDRVEADTGHVLCREMQGFPEELLLTQDTSLLPFINSATWNKLFRTDCIGELRFPLLKTGEDLCFLHSVLRRCRKVAFIDDILIHYRVREGSIITHSSDESARYFAEALYSLWSQSGDEKMRDALAMTAFIHIGISMPMRISVTSGENLKQSLSWISEWFSDKYDWFRGNRLFRMSSLLKHGVHGLGILVVRLCYRLHCMRFFLWVYRTMSRIFRMDIKF